jgi:hypothetical protein
MPGDLNDRKSITQDFYFVDKGFLELARFFKVLNRFNPKTFL